MKWRARGVYARGAFRRAEASNGAYDRIAAQRFEKRCATMRSKARVAASARRNAPRARAPCVVPLEACF
eukprot:11204259-Lingulodinium_polyedra.AAC.1